MSNSWVPVPGVKMKRKRDWHLSWRVGIVSGEGPTFLTLRLCDVTDNGGYIDIFSVQIGKLLISIHAIDENSIEVKD